MKLVGARRAACLPAVRRLERLRVCRALRAHVWHRLHGRHFVDDPSEIFAPALARLLAASDVVLSSRGGSSAAAFDHCPPCSRRSCRSRSMFQKGGGNVPASPLVFRVVGPDDAMALFARPGIRCRRLVCRISTTGGTRAAVRVAQCSRTDPRAPLAGGIDTCRPHSHPFHFDRGACNANWFCDSPPSALLRGLHLARRPRPASSMARAAAAAGSGRMRPTLHLVAMPPVVSLSLRSHAPLGPASGPMHTCASRHGSAATSAARLHAVRKPSANGSRFLAASDACHSADITRLVSPVR